MEFKKKKRGSDAQKLRSDTKTTSLELTPELHDDMSFKMVPWCLSIELKKGIFSWYFSSTSDDESSILFKTVIHKLWGAPDYARKATIAII